MLSRVQFIVSPSNEQLAGIGPKSDDTFVYKIDISKPGAYDELLMSMEMTTDSAVQRPRSFSRRSMFCTLPPVVN